MLLYYITDRRQFSGSPEDQRAALLRKISEAAQAGVDLIQLREKDLRARELLQLAREAADIIRSNRVVTDNSQLVTRLLINSRIDVAIAAGADGVHLRSDDIFPADARAVIVNAGYRPLAADHFLVGTSCHTAADVRRAGSESADFVVFAPVFEKGGQCGVGLEALRDACRGMPASATPEPSHAVKIPVLALGGVNVENSRACIEAGAEGIAGIRLFQENDVARVVAKLRK